jgi:hypothetical protein
MKPELLALIEWLNSRHKVFVSYYHDEDQEYRNRFEERFGHLFISKSVYPGDINTDASDEYIKRLIQQRYITDSSVLIVLVGPNTWRRKHVDWEISAALNKKVGGHSGLIGILLPTFPVENGCYYYYRDLPSRLADNARSGYAKIHMWPSVWLPDIYVETEIDAAFQRRRTHSRLIENWRPQYAKDENPTYAPYISEEFWRRLLPISPPPGYANYSSGDPQDPALSPLLRDLSLAYSAQRPWQ